MDPITVGVITTIVSSAILGVMMFFGRLMLRGLKDWMEEEIRSHLVPNGGSSLADKLSRIEKNVSSLMDLHREGHPHR